MESVYAVTNENKEFYNLRKRLGAEIARRVFDFWYHYHLEGPVSSDEALFYYLLGGDL